MVFLQACNETLLLDQRQVQAMMIKARAMKIMGRVNEAMNMLRRVLGVKPEFEEATVMMESLEQR